MKASHNISTSPNENERELVEQLIGANSISLHNIFSSMTREEAGEAAELLQRMFLESEDRRLNLIPILLVFIEECPFVSFNEEFMKDLEIEASKRKMLEQLTGEMDSLLFLEMDKEGCGMEAE